MDKEEAVFFMVLPLLLAALIGVVGSLGADLLIVGFVLIGLGAVAVVGSGLLLVRARAESALVLGIGTIVALAGGVTAIVGNSV